MERDEGLPATQDDRLLDGELVSATSDAATGEAALREVPQFRSRKRLAAMLFVATCVTTFLNGMLQTAVRNPTLWDFVLNGLQYAVPLMAILLFHEMGHYLQSVRYGVPATLPFFIPMPPLINPFGTMGAVIVQGAGVADRRQLFDIAVSGPLAGLVLAMPIAWLGVLQSEHRFVDPDATAMLFGDPLVLQWMIQAVHGPLPDGHEVMLNPMLFAGWVGIFITALNLIPIGQLDGGHILYTLIGRRAHGVALAVLFGAIGFMVYTGYYAYILLVVLLMMMGPRHPPTANDNVPLGTTRVLVGWATLLFIIVGFTPTPIMIVGPKQRDAEQAAPAEKRSGEEASAAAEVRRAARAELLTSSGSRPDTAGAAGLSADVSHGGRRAESSGRLWYNPAR